MLSNIILISACGKNDKTDIEGKKETLTEETQESTIAGGDVLFPSEGQMAKDIDSFGANVISLKNGEYTLKTKSIKINKAKKNTEQYLVYCTATQESDMFKANNSYVMTYNYYDIGGWALDECYVENVDMTPKISIPEEDVRDYADKGSDFTSLEYIKTEKISDKQYVFRYLGKYEYNYMDDEYNIDVNCTYDNDNGWNINSEIISSYHNWSKTYGTWVGENSDWKFKLIVKEVDEATDQLKCDVILEYPKDYEGMTEKERKVTKKNCTAKIAVVTYSNLYDEGVEYTGNVKKIHTYYDKCLNIDIDSELDIEWGKDVGINRICYSDNMGELKTVYLTKEK